jgi:hypothetical protein
MDLLSEDPRVVVGPPQGRRSDALVAPVSALVPHGCCGPACGPERSARISVGDQGLGPIGGYAFDVGHVPVGGRLAASGSASRCRASAYAAYQSHQSCGEKGLLEGVVALGSLSPGLASHQVGSHRVRGGRRRRCRMGLAALAVEQRDAAEQGEGHRAPPLSRRSFPRSDGRNAMLGPLSRHIGRRATGRIRGKAGIDRGCPRQARASRPSIGAVAVEGDSSTSTALSGGDPASEVAAGTVERVGQRRGRGTSRLGPAERARKKEISRAPSPETG